MAKRALRTDPQRSALMGRVRQRGTAAELSVRGILRARGYGYRVCVPSLPGKPDIVLTRYHTAIFVNGCFWHGHVGCPRATVPKTHARFWQGKIAANRVRDAKVTAELEVLGWNVLTVWECELGDVDILAERLTEALTSAASISLQRKGGVMEIPNLFQDLADLRTNYYAALSSGSVIFSRELNAKSRAITGCRRAPNIADCDSASSVKIAVCMAEILGLPDGDVAESAQATGANFTTVTKDFVKAAFALLQKWRPGQWTFTTSGRLADYYQYEHLGALSELVTKISKLFSGSDEQLPLVAEGPSPRTSLEVAAGELRNSLALDYIVIPDIVVYRSPVDESLLLGETIGEARVSEIAKLTAFRARNVGPQTKIMHASISCKLTIRSDRAQNTRTEALNLLRNRKGHAPHMVAVTAEPLATRLASLALGSGDLDCTYHIALPELVEATKATGCVDQLDMLQQLVEGRRLRDISDLPLDLAI